MAQAGATGERSVISGSVEENPFDDTPVEGIASWNYNRRQEKSADPVVGLVPGALQEPPGGGRGAGDGDERSDLGDVQLRPSVNDVSHDADAILLEGEIGCAARMEIERHAPGLRRIPIGIF